MASASKFPFQAPNPAMLDPSTLEQIYAQGAARKMGPGFALVGQQIAQRDRQDSASAYLQALDAINKRADEAGRLQLRQELLANILQHGAGLLKERPMFSSTPLGQQALSVGQGNISDLANALAAIGVDSERARQMEGIGKGAEGLIQAGIQPTFEGRTITELPTAPARRGVAPQVQAAAINANASLKPRTVVTLPAGGTPTVTHTTGYNPNITPQSVIEEQTTGQKKLIFMHGSASKAIGQENASRLFDAFTSARLPTDNIRAEMRDVQDPSTGRVTKRVVGVNNLTGDVYILGDNGALHSGGREPVKR